ETRQPRAWPPARVEEPPPGTPPRRGENDEQGSHAQGTAQTRGLNGKLRQFAVLSTAAVALVLPVASHLTCPLSGNVRSAGHGVGPDANASDVLTPIRCRGCPQSIMYTSPDGGDVAGSSTVHPRGGFSCPVVAARSYSPCSHRSGFRPVRSRGVLLLAGLFTWLDRHCGPASPSSCDPLVRPQDCADPCASAVRTGETGTWQGLDYNIAIDVVDSALG